MEATSGIEPEYADLQSAASPLRHVASDAGSKPALFLMQDEQGFYSVIFEGGSIGGALGFAKYGGLLRLWPQNGESQ